MRHWRGRTRHRLRSRLFWWFGATIAATGFVVSVTIAILPFNGMGWAHDSDQLRGLAGDAFAQVWQRPSERTALAESIARRFQTRVEVLDAAGATLSSTGSSCDRRRMTVPVRSSDGQALGSVAVCFAGHHRGGWFFIVVLLAAGATLWAASGAIARRLARPLDDLVRVARAIGEGDLSSRARLWRHQPGEVGVLAEALNDMAARIEKQMADQRELLAAVSHEIRTPLARIRVLLELCREQGTSADRIDKLEREVVEIDALVGDLLASSRLEFAALDVRPLDARALGAEALERSGLPPEILSAECASSEFAGDATLILRALSNVLENAKAHGGNVLALTIRDAPDDALVFEVTDAGPGFSEQALKNAFSPFYREGSGARTASSLGLGLSLVQRIATAHGGRAWALNRPGGGASVALSVARRWSNPK